MGHRMREHFPAKWIPLLGTLVLPAIAGAADFPSQLWGRSVVVNWNTQDEGQPSAGSFNNQFSVYVSGAGRTFSRMTASSARSTRSELGPINSRVSTAISVYFENGALMADVKMASSALRVAISFDAAYGRCSAAVIFDGDGGERVRGTGIGASSCSIADGNVFVGR
jgi:hypothetical protein